MVNSRPTLELGMPPLTSSSSRIARFGVFEVDLRGVNCEKTACSMICLMSTGQNADAGRLALFCGWWISDRIEVCAAQPKSTATPAASAYFHRFANKERSLLSGSGVVS